jgi:hypothetical protein
LKLAFFIFLALIIIIIKVAETKQAVGVLEDKIRKLKIRLIRLGARGSVSDTSRVSG